MDTKRADEALRRLEVEPEDVAKCPNITEVLRTAFKEKPNDAIAAARFSDDTAAIEFLACYDAIPVGDRPYISIEAICVKSRVNPTAFVGAVFLACKKIRGQESALLAVNSHPEVLRNTIRFAAEPGGDRDRKMIHEAVGFLPTKNGVSMSVNLIGGQPQLHNPAKKDLPAPEDTNDAADFAELFPSINRDLEEWSQDRQLALSDGN